MPNENAIRGRVRELGAHDRVAAAISAVLDLKPPTRHRDDDPKEYAVATDGWFTCMASVQRVLAEKLEVR